MSHVFITGATGALGSEVVLRFAAASDARVTVLLRAESDEHLASRREKLLRYWCSAAPGLDLEQRIEAARGDITAESLGLESAVESQLIERVTHVVHSAGNVRLNQTMEDARATAVSSARAVVDFVRRCQSSGQFRKLEFVSTVGIAGRTPGLIPEARFPGPRGRSDFHNTYEAAKWEAESYLWDQIDAGLPATIHRPSMIVGDSQTGRIMHYQVFYYLTDFLTGRRTRGFVPRTGEAVLDIIPVDYVASAIHVASEAETSIGQVWHLCSGPKNCWSLERLVETLRQLQERSGRPLPALKRLPLSAFRRMIGAASLIAPSRSRGFLKGLPFLLDYLDERQLFENSCTNELLSENGVTIPPVDSYLETIMAPYWERHARGSSTL